MKKNLYSVVRDYYAGIGSSKSDWAVYLVGSDNEANDVPIAIFAKRTHALGFVKLVLLAKKKKSASPGRRKARK